MDTPAQPQIPHIQSERSSAADTLLLSVPDDLVDAILAHNSSLKALLLHSDALWEKPEYVAELPDPSVMVTGQPLPIHTARGTQVVQIRAEQMVPYPGKRRLMREMAVFEAEMGVEAARTAASEMILEAQMALEEVRRIEDQLHNLNAYRDRLRNFEAIALRKYEVGEGAQQGIWKLQLEQSRLAQTEIGMNRMIQSRVAVIERLVQHPIRVVQAPAAISTSFGQKGDFSDRSEIRRMNLAGEMAASRQRLEILKGRPDFGVNMTWFSITESGIPASSDGRDALAVGIMLKLPLGKSANRARRKQSEIAAAAIEENLQAVLTTLDLLHRDQTAQMVEDTRQLRHLDRELLPTAEALLEASITSYSNGTAGFLDLLDAERMHFQIKKDRIDVNARLRTGELMLNRISGRLDASIHF